MQYCPTSIYVLLHIHTFDLRTVFLNALLYIYVLEIQYTYCT